MNQCIFCTFGNIWWSCHEICLVHFAEYWVYDDDRLGVASSLTSSPCFQGCFPCMLLFYNNPKKLICECRLFKRANTWFKICETGQGISANSAEYNPFISIPRCWKQNIIHLIIYFSHLQIFNSIGCQLTFF